MLIWQLKKRFGRNTGSYNTTPQRPYAGPSRTQNTKQSHHLQDISRTTVRRVFAAHAGHNHNVAEHILTAIKGEREKTFSY